MLAAACGRAAWYLSSVTSAVTKFSVNLNKFALLRNARGAGQPDVAAIVRRVKGAGIRVSLFLDPDVEQVDAAAAVATDRIELYTESYARAFGTARQAEVLADFATAARRAQELGLGVNAGHDLNLANLGPFLAAVPGVLEVSIGHAVVCEAFDHTLEGTVDR